MQYLNKPSEIENTSMDIIDKYMKDCNFTENQELVAKRMIHSSGDVDYRKIIVFKNNFIDSSSKALKKGIKIFSDTNMVYSGINKTALQKSNCELICLIANREVFDKAKKEATTRSYAAVDLAVDQGATGFVIGNAPTALFRLLELTRAGKVEPEFIVGLPVGFVGAAESKVELRETECPQVSTVGTKGGSSIAASVVNALLYMNFGR